MATKKTQTGNPQDRAINQKQGPRTGNMGTPSKRDDFKSMKSDRSSEKSKLADFVISALEGRGNGTKPAINPALENLSPNSAKSTGIKKNVTADGTRLPSKYKQPKTKG
jgi:hypothetical protein